MKLKLCCLIILTVFACNKANQWKQPVEVLFSVNLQTGKVLQERLRVERGILTVKALVFESNRTEGADLYFVQTEEATKVLALESDLLNAWNFDLPKGTYNSMLVHLKPPKETPLLVLDASYNQGGKICPMRIECTLEALSFELNPGQTNTELLHSPTTEQLRGLLTIDPLNWLAELEPGMLQQATRTMRNGQSIILVNVDNNTGIYNKIVRTINQQRAKIDLMPI